MGQIPEGPANLADVYWSPLVFFVFCFSLPEMNIV